MDKEHEKTMASEGQTFDDLYALLTSSSGQNNAGRPQYPVLPNPSSRPKSHQITNSISEQQFHPVLESMLHILNSDLQSAHFLLRHMQSEPAWEAMYLHGILHRIEGDYRNAEAWYKDVSQSQVFQHVWAYPETAETTSKALGDRVDQAQNESPHSRAVAFVRQVEKLRKDKIGNLKDLEVVSQHEIDKFTEFCKNKFGTRQVRDASKVWVKSSDKNSQIANDMIVGGEGWRKF